MRSMTRHPKGLWTARPRARRAIAVDVQTLEGRQLLSSAPVYIYAPSDANIFSLVPNGPVKFPGKVRDYLIIESFGKPGRINPNDPTTTLERSRVESRKLIAFAQIGLITLTNQLTASLLQPFIGSYTDRRSV